jgi:hypothetical protein
MRIDDYEVCMSFRDMDGMTAADGADVGFLSHSGTQVFSVLNGIERSKFWLYNKSYPVGIAKSHTTLDDRGTSEYSQLAIFVAGSCSVMNNGLYSIPAGTEVRISFYDVKNDPDTFEKIFKNRAYMDGDDVRVVPVVEPYYREDDMIDMLNLNLPLITGEMDEEDFRATSGLSPGEWEDRDSFQGILKRLHSSVIDTMLFGAFVFSVHKATEVVDPRAEPRPEMRVSSIREALLDSGSDFINQLSRFKRTLRGDDTSLGSSSFASSVAKMLYSRAPGDNIGFNVETRGDDEIGKKIDLVEGAQRGVRKSLLHQRELIMWERRWVIGTSLSTANPGERMWLKIHRGCY